MRWDRNRGLLVFPMNDTLKHKGEGKRAQVAQGTLERSILTMYPKAKSERTAMNPELGLADCFNMTLIL